MSAGRVLEGRVAVITGANQGVGLAIAEKYLDAGASVAICARNGSLLEDAHKRLEGRCVGGQRVHSSVVDVSVSAQCERFAREAVENFGALHVLVNNAGIYGPKGFVEETPLGEWESAVGTNLLGSMYMFRAVLSFMKDARYGKIVQMSGGGATKPMQRASAYAATKAAVVRLAETVAEEVRAFNIDVNSIAPGAVNTRLLDEILAAGPKRVGEKFYRQSVEQKETGGVHPSVAADLAVFLGSGLSDGITGKLISAVWDDWRVFPDHVEELSRSDVYTLRRITAEDRGFSWGGK